MKDHKLCAWVVVNDIVVVGDDNFCLSVPVKVNYHRAFRGSGSHAVEAGLVFTCSTVEDTKMRHITIHHLHIAIQIKIESGHGGAAGVIAGRLLPHLLQRSSGRVIPVCRHPISV